MGASIIADRVLVSNSYKAITTKDEEGNEDTSYITDGIIYDNGDKYSYTYDSDNENITGIIIDGKLAYEMTYDSDDNITKQVDHINGENYTYEYDADGNTTAVKGSDGFNILYLDTETTTDGTTTLTNTAGESNVYKFDKNNNIKSITKDDKEVASYKYDGLEQLVRENDEVADKTYVYTYDEGGNIVSKKVGGFQIYGKISKNRKGTVTYRLTYVWNDIIDPKYSYDTDKFKVKIAKKIANPKDYIIKIIWSDVSIVYSKGRKGKGWLGK